MKKNFNKLTSLLICACIISCVSFNDKLLTGKGNVNKARKNVIIDFANTFKTPRNYLKERQGKPFDVFWVYKKKSKKNLFIFMITPETGGHISLGIKDELGKVPVSYFPNNFEVKEEKLFLWKDSLKPLRKNVLDIVENFGVLDSTDVKRELGLLPDNFKDDRFVSIDHKIKSVYYYVCKNNIKKYIKVISNKAIFKYRPPIINCD